jgi:hypothetical protein
MARGERTMDDLPESTALVKAPANAALKRSENKKTVRAETNVSKVKNSLNDIAEIVRIGAAGGEAAGWGLTCAGVAMTIGILAHSASFFAFGPVGMAIGVGIYGTKVFDRWRKFRNKTTKELSDQLEDNDLLFVTGKLTKREYNARRKAILSKFN